MSRPALRPTWHKAYRISFLG